MNAGRVLQLDEYELSYSPDKIGKQTVTVSYQGKTAEFEIMIIEKGTHWISLDKVNAPAETKTVLAGLYDANGKQIKVLTVDVSGSIKGILLSDAEYKKASYVKVFYVDSAFAPTGEVLITDVE